MAFRFTQQSEGEVSYDPARAVVRYQVEGTVVPAGIDPFDYISHYAIVPGVIPRTYAHPSGPLWLQDIQIHENHAGRIYSISCPYGRTQKESGAYQITVDQSGGSVNVPAGTRIAGFATDPADEVDNGGLIGVDGDEIHGVDIPVEETKISVNFRHPAGTLNAAYIRAIGQLVGYPCGVPFLGYEAGEPLYLGGQFTQTETEASAAYSFAISYKRVAFVVGGITVTEKHGWDVLSFSYFDEIDNGHNAKRIKCIEVVRPAGREWKDYVATFGWGA